MKRAIPFLVALCLLAQGSIPASAHSAGNYPAQAEQLSAEQLDNLLAPIALYPDPLLAQLLPASTFVEQIDQAARWLRANSNNTSGIDNQSWDVSVKSVSHYPQVVYMMAEKMDWTTALGQSYVNQSTDVFTSIQRLRARAKEAGNLKSTKEQQVIVEKEVIKIVPAQPQVIYVPTYNPQVVYVQQPAPSTGTVVAASMIAFGAGLAIGAWLNNDCNWHSHTVYYHGWRGTGWVSASYSHVRVNSVYVNRSYTNVHVNTAVVNRNVNYNNVSHYNNVSRNVNYNNVNRTNVNVNNVNVNNVNRNNVNVNNVNQNNINRNNVNQNNVNSTTKRNVNTNDARVNSYRGQSGQSAGASMRSSSAFGGNTSGGDATRQSQRGQASRQSMRQSAGSRSQTRERPARQSSSGGRGRRN